MVSRRSSNRKSGLKQFHRISPFWTNIPNCITTVSLHNNHGEEPLTVPPCSI